MSINFKTNFAYLPYGIWVFFVFISMFYAYELVHGVNAWKIGDWLINYSAGPVRRGLIGSFLLGISSSGDSLIWMTYLIQVACYGTIFFLVFKLYRLKERGLFWLLILFNPAFLLFPFYDLQGGFRKEIIVLMAFVILCYQYANKKINAVVLTGVALIYGVAAFSHELAAFTLPGFLYIFYASFKKNLITLKTFLIQSTLLCVVSFTAFLFSVFFKGNPFIAIEICNSLMERGVDGAFCRGPIDALGGDASGAVSQVASLLRPASMLAPIAFLLAIFPLFFLTFDRKKLATLVLVGLISMSPLYVFAMDWGRWIHIQVFMLFCIALAEDLKIKFVCRKNLIALGIIYLLTWHIPHDNVGGLGGGMLERAKEQIIAFIKFYI